MNNEISFLCAAYRAGVRITHDGTGFVYHAADWLRIVHTRTFGLFPVSELVEPPAHMVADATLLAPTLTPLLRQRIPSGLAGWWYHPLISEYEGVPLLRMAAKRNVAVWLVPCALGVWPVVVAMPLDGTYSSGMPTLSPILEREGYSFNLEAYRILGEGNGTRKNGDNHLDKHVGPKVRAGSAGEPGAPWARNGSGAHPVAAGR